MAAATKNMLLEDVQYKIEETANGVWRSFLYPSGQRFSEFKTHLSWGGMPLLHYTYGICPETGKRVTARGVVAVGRFAHGLIAIGQVSLGLIALGQFSFGLIFCFAQFGAGAVSIGQAAIGVLFGAGQLATGQIAIGQFAYGHYVLAQLGLGKYVIDSRMVDPTAKEFFLGLIGK
jgi:hypothetical protein